MVNFKQSLINLHKEFPDWDLDTLFKVIECIVEESTFTLPNRIDTRPWDTITTNPGSTKPFETGMVWAQNK